MRGADRLEFKVNDPDLRWQPVDWSGVPLELKNSRAQQVPASNVRSNISNQPLLVAVTRHHVTVPLKLRIAGGTFTSILSGQGEAQLSINLAERSPLSVHLPDGASLLNVFVNGQSVALVRESEAYLFHVFSKEGSPLADVGFSCVLYGQQSLRSVALTNPRLNIPLQKFTWQVILPSGYTLTQASGDLDLQNRQRDLRIDLGKYLAKHQQMPQPI